MGRAKGTGSLVKRGNIWTAIWKVDGKTHTRTTGCTSKRDAYAKLDEFVHPYQVKSEIETLENLQSQINVLENERKKTPLENAIKLMFAVDTYRKDINQSELSEKTVALYECCINQLKKFSKKDFMYEISQEDAYDFLQHVKEKNSVHSYNTYICCLKQIWEVCKRHDSNIRKNVFAEYKFLKDTVHAHRRGFTDEEVESLLKAASEISFQFGLFFKLGAYTGMRKEDCLSLKKSEVDFDAGLIRRVPIKTQKTGITATIPIADELRDDLKKAIDESDCEYVIPEVMNMTQCILATKMASVFDKCGIKQSEKDKNGKSHHVTGFHSFRHTLTKKLYRQKLSVNVIMAIMGHKSINTSLHYGSAIESDIPKIDFGSKMKNCSCKKELYAKVMSYGNGNDTFSDALEKMIKMLKEEKRDTEAYRAFEIERKKREDEELEKLLDEFFDEDGKPIKDIPRYTKRKMVAKGMIKPVAKEGAKGTWVEVDSKK